MIHSEFTKEEMNEERSLRRITFFGIAITTMSALTAMIAVPMLYNYMQHIQSSLQSEIEHCQSISRDLLMEFIEVSSTSDGFRSKRALHEHLRKSEGNTKQYPPRSEFTSVRGSEPYDRSAAILRKPLSVDHMSSNDGEEAAFGDGGLSYGYGAAVSDDGRSLYNGGQPPHDDSKDVASSRGLQQSRCGCAWGPSGPAGPPGADGTPGNDGVPGSDGSPGTDAVNTDATKPHFCFDCPSGQMGPAGQQGPKGQPGPPGLSGKRAMGMIGPAGPQGLPGKPGIPGPVGQGGRPGVPGQVEEVTGGAGPPGPPGPQGPPGNSGQPGVEGVASPGPQGPAGPPGPSGPPGSIGQPGSQGDVGNSGNSGGCDHCPPPRLAPGY